MRVFNQINEAHAALFRASDQELKARFGLGTSQLTVLFLLQQEDGQAISKLAAALSLGKSALTGLVARMQERGLVKRGSDSNDGRVYRVFISANGRKLAASAQPIVKDINTALLQHFSNEEQETIARFLQHINSNAAQIVQQVHSQHNET